ncbi:MAG: glycosyltransferase [Oscillospiraceae bacterium]|nr:glycosyltransferase [Oscillospiraceae bacterium]
MKVSVYLQVYHTPEAYLRQCIESVLTQTFTDFEFLIVDNGCTDGSSEIIRAYAEQDSRIRVLRYEINDPKYFYYLVGTIENGEYLTTIDSDDWWEPDYLERLVQFAQEHDLDIACTGSFVHEEATGKITSQALPAQRIMSSVQFLTQVDQYAWFFQTVWNKLIRLSVVRQMRKPVDFTIACHRDTLFCYELLRYAENIAIDNSVLHHYLVRKESVMQSYDRTRFAAHIYFYHYIIKFLADFGVTSDENALFWRRRLLGSFNREILLEMTSTFSSEEKLCHYREMATQPSMYEFYQWSMPEVKKCMVLFLQCIIAEKAELDDDNADFTAVVDALAPHCGEPGETLMLREHERVCRLLEQGESTKALEQMDRILHANENLYNLKAFVKGYIALAKREGRCELVQYGKLRLAKHYLGRGENRKCQALLNEVTAEATEGIKLFDFPELETWMKKYGLEK